MRVPRKDRPWSARSPDEGPWDTIVIGSGIGGLTAAAFLAKLGHRVLVLEQHTVPGGFTHTFQRGPWSWDVGVHAVGEVTAHALPGRLLAWLTDGRLRWASLGPVYDAFHYPDGFRIDFPDHPERFRDNLVAAFPREQAAIDRYLALVREVTRGMGRYYLGRVLPPALGTAADLVAGSAVRRWLTTSTRDVIDGLTSDPRLRAVLVAQWGYYGSPPSRSSFAMQALVTRHFLWGGYYPEGGSGQIAYALARTVAEAGGWTRICADVEQILVEGGRAVGVRLAGGERILARRVVSAAGVHSTVRRLLPTDVARGAWATSVDALSPASAHVCLYLGFEGDIRAAGAGSANLWFYGTWDPEDDAWRVAEDLEPLPAPSVLYTSFPSLKDPLHEGAHHTGEVVTFVPWAAFERWRGARWKKRGPDYEAFKERLKERMLEGLLAHLPGLRQLVRHAELSTPVSTEHFVRPVEGSIYGLEPTPARFRNRWLRPKSPIPGLYFAGSEVATVGVVGAAMGGALAAVAVEPLRALGRLRALR